jgi:predicted SAM-dependent methyltransferase
MDYLNLGCGYRFHPAWTNVNYTATGKGVIVRNLNKGIPFPDASFDVVYHSHVLEHFTKTAGETFLKECYRVLRPQGVLRVVVPDLEQLVRSYLMALEKASAGDEEYAANYEWILIEIFDQMVRNSTRGLMMEYLSRKNISNEKFVLMRLGIDEKEMIDEALEQIQHPKFKLLPKDRYKLLLKQNINRLLELLGGKYYKALRVGLFRQSGEIHHWMYDRYSLAILLQKCGLEDIVQRTATDSYIPDWTSFNLDSDANGVVHKPGSLFIEGIKRH